MRRSNVLLHQIQLVEGASEDWIPRMKEHFGIETFDFVFLDHWKDRYLPDTKLMEVCLILTTAISLNLRYYVSLPVAQTIEYGTSNEEVMGSIPRKNKNRYKCECVLCIKCPEVSEFAAVPLFSSLGFAHQYYIQHFLLVSCSFFLCRIVVC